MVYLSSRQGLEDLGHFINNMNHMYNLTGPWITFGGSYPGSLSAWMRLRFPHLVADALDTTGAGCNTAMTEALTTVENMVGDENSWEDLGSMFQLCGPLDGSNELDVKSFMELLIDNIAAIVQYNGRYEEDIFSICNVMTDESLGKPIDRLAVVNDIMLSLNQEECVDHTYNSFLSLLTDTTWVGGGVGWRQWIWQTCTEFGWYQTTNQESGVYGHTLPLE